MFEYRITGENLYGYTTPIKYIESGNLIYEGYLSINEDVKNTSNLTPSDIDKLTKTKLTLECLHDNDKEMEFKVLAPIEMKDLIVTVYK